MVGLPTRPARQPCQAVAVDDALNLVDVIVRDMPVQSEVQGTFEGSLHERLGGDLERNNAVDGEWGTSLHDATSIAD